VSIKFSPLSGNRWSLYDALTDIARQAQPKAYLEIGVSHGDSLKCVLDSCQPEHLTLCDSWGSESGGQDLKGHAHITALLNKAGYWGDVKFLDGSSHDLLLRQFFKHQYDLILVDGDHTEEGAAQDLHDIVPLLAPGGYVVFDDIAPDFFHPYLLDVWNKFLSDWPTIVERHRILVDKFPPHTASHGVVVGQKL
jgi:predicted O-methyltransferase YrrM